MPKQDCRLWQIPAPWELAKYPKETPVLLALSGGADSRALLHLLAEFSKRDGFPLTVAHIQHGIRGAESLRDRDFCRSLAAAYGVECAVLDTDVPALAREHGTGIEEEARQVRYRYFASLMRERNIPILVTAHHADDNLETVLFRLARGSGLHGLCGIAEAREFAGGMLVRPLLKITKEEILGFCRENKLEFVTDGTNADLTYARNRIRGEVIPVLESLFPGVALRAAATVSSLAEDEAVLSDEADAFLQKNGGELPCGELQALPPAVRKRVLTRAVTEAAGKPPEEVHLTALCDLIAGKTPNAEVALPGDAVAQVVRSKLRISEKLPAPEPYCLPFAVGRFTVGGVEIRVRNGADPECKETVSNGYDQISVNLPEPAKLCWRPMRDGDEILRGGMHRKVRKLYAESGIPANLRRVLPLLCNGESILWVPFVGASDGVKNAGNESIFRVAVGFPDATGKEPVYVSD